MQLKVVISRKAFKNGSELGATIGEQKSNGKAGSCENEKNGRKNGEGYGNTDKDLKTEMLW